MTGYLPYCRACKALTWTVGQPGKRRCAICKSDHGGWIPEPPGHERSKEPMHPHSEDAGQPHNPAALHADELRLGLRAVIAIANEALDNPGCADGYLERIIQRAGDALHAGQEGEE